MIHPIVLYNSPILRQKATAIQRGTDVKNLIADMFETMRSAKGCGLAAPQIGKSIQLFVVEFSLEENQKPIKRVVINPSIVIDETAQSVNFEEGCLSIPGVTIPVPRKEALTIEYFDENWNEKKEQINGFLARVILHEYDHLIGKLIIDYAMQELKEKISETLALTDNNNCDAISS